VFLIINIHTVSRSGHRLRMLPILGLVLYVLSISSVGTAYAQVHNQPWDSSQNIYIADTEAIHIVDTRSIYINLRSCYIADTASIFIVDARNIHVVFQDSFITAQSAEEEWVQAYDIHNFLLQMSNSRQERITNSQNKSGEPPTIKILDVSTHAHTVQESVSAQRPLLPLPSDIPTQRKENAWVAASSTASTSSKSKIYYPTLYNDIVRMRQGESAYLYIHKSQIGLHQIKNKDIYLITSGLRGPPVTLHNC
jgi:hypothetical protein